MLSVTLFYICKLSPVSLKGLQIPGRQQAGGLSGCRVQCGVGWAEWALQKQPRASISFGSSVAYGCDQTWDALRGQGGEKSKALNQQITGDPAADSEKVGFGGVMNAWDLSEEFITLQLRSSRNHEADFETLFCFFLIFCYFNIFEVWKICHLIYLSTLGIWLAQRNA